MSLSPLSDYLWDAPDLSLFGGDLPALDYADSPFSDCISSHIGGDAITEGQADLFTDHASKSSNKMDVLRADIFSDILPKDTALENKKKETADQDASFTVPPPECKSVPIPLFDLVDQISHMPDESVLDSTLSQTPPESPIATTFIPFDSDRKASFAAIQGTPVSDVFPAVVQSNSQYTPPLTPSVSPAPLSQHDESGDTLIDDDELTNQLLQYLENAQAEMEFLPQSYDAPSSMDVELTSIASEHLSNISAQDTLPVVAADVIADVLSPESGSPVLPVHDSGSNSEAIVKSEPSPSELKTLLLAPIPPVSFLAPSSPVNFLAPSSPVSQTVSYTDSEDEDPTWKLEESNTGPVKKGRKRTAVIVPPYRKDPSLQKCLNKKERKKQQNKEAATRYREKKRQESEGIGQEEQELLAKNKELKDKVSDISKEISYLKNLLLEVHKAKLLGKAAN